MKVKVIKILNTNISMTNGQILTKFDGQLPYHTRMTSLNFEGQGQGHSGTLKFLT